MSRLPPGSIAVVLGTRPEIIKTAIVVRLLGPAARVIHTGQHYETALSSVFFEAFGIPEPTSTLGVGGAGRGEQIGAAVAALSVEFAANRPAVVVVQGDTNSAAAGALAANAAEIPLVHIEAGLRSFDRRMPEEHNRVIADHLADVLCAPTAVNRDNLIGEGIAGERIHLTGNPIVEAVSRLLPPPERSAAIAAAHGVTPGEFILGTFHRPENVDEPGVLRTLMTALGDLDAPMLLPLHPRTAARLSDGGIALSGRVHTVPPIGYPEFLALASTAALLVSDSGGIQEEASIVKRPVIVVRRSTERPEVLGTFATLIPPGPAVAAAANALLADLAAIHTRLADLPSPYGDGTASERIHDLVVTAAVSDRR